MKKSKAAVNAAALSVEKHQSGSKPISAARNLKLTA